MAGGPSPPRHGQWDGPQPDPPTPGCLRRSQGVVVNYRNSLYNQSSPEKRHENTWDVSMGGGGYRADRRRPVAGHTAVLGPPALLGWGLRLPDPHLAPSLLVSRPLWRSMSRESACPERPRPARRSGGTRGPTWTAPPHLRGACVLTSVLPLASPGTSDLPPPRPALSWVIWCGRGGGAVSPSGGPFRTLSSCPALRNVTMTVWVGAFLSDGL